MPLHQRLGNDWLALAVRLLFGLRLSDDGPFRAVSGALLERLALEERAYAFPTEMAVKARLLGARIVVVDTRYRRRAGRSKIAGTWRGSLLAVRDITWCLCPPAARSAFAPPTRRRGGSAAGRAGRRGVTARPRHGACDLSTPAAAGAAGAAPGGRRGPSVRPDCDTATTRQIAASAM